MVGRTHAKLNGTLVYGASCTMSYLAVDQERRVTMTQKYTVFMVLILGVIQAYYSSLLLCGVSIVGTLFPIIIIMKVLVLLTKLHHTTLTTTIRCGPTTTLWSSAEWWE